MWREKETLCKQVIFFSVLMLSVVSHLSENKDSAIQGLVRLSPCSSFPLWLCLWLLFFCLLSQTYISPGLFSNSLGISYLRATTHAVPPPEMLFLQIFTWLPFSSLRAVLTYCLCSEALPGHLMYSNGSLPIISSYFLRFMLLFSAFQLIPY